MPSGKGGSMKDGSPMTEYENDKLIYFDIETEPREMSDILAIAGEFDPASVKTGNYGPEKSREKIDKARSEYADNLFERAPLDARLGKVLAIGYLDREYNAFFCPSLEEERERLDGFWSLWRNARHSGHTFVGWNIHSFDLPFLIRRSWWQGVLVPGELTRLTGNGFRSYPGTIDLCRVWTGDPREHCKLDDVARFFGLPGKRMKGADFWRQWRKGGIDREEAEAYLRYDDVESLKVIAGRIL